MPKNKPCLIETCVRPAEEEGLCDNHIPEWQRSPEFRDAVTDKKVRAAMGLGLTKQAMRYVAKFRRKWAERINNAVGA